MTDLFLKLLDMSLSASWIVLAVLAARLLLKTAPRWLVCSLWGLVALRLLCPFSLESMFSLVPQVSLPPTTAEEPLPQRLQELQWDESSAPGDRMSVSYPNDRGENIVYEVYLDQDGTTKAVEPRQVALRWPVIACRMWLAGMLSLMGYALFSYLRIRRKVQVSVDLGNRVYLCDYINTPFILGIVKPRIYLPSEMDPRDAAQVLAHERAHLKRRDHWWKPLGFGLLCIHWFNPLLWIAYILLCRDIELACDEKVIKNFGTAEKKAYSEALLKCSVPRHLIAACPLAFGEVGVRQRIRSVLHYKKPGIWILAVSVLVILIVALGFLTEQPDAELTSPFEEELWLTELIYTASEEPMYNIPSSLLDNIMLTQTYGTNTIANHPEPVFTQTKLTMENFDVLFDESSEWSRSSARKLRQQNENAWVLHDVSSHRSANSHKFYYLLQQKNGDLYLTYGRWWDAQLRPGKTEITLVGKLEKAAVTRPFSDGETPYVYTRTISYKYIAGHAWQPLTLAQEDINIDDYEIYIPELINILHCVPESALKLEAPIQNVECSIVLDVDNSEVFDVQLRYGEGKVEMAFHEDCTWSFADTGNLSWHINYDGLAEFFHRYSPSFTLPEYLLEPLDLHSWRSKIHAADLKNVSVFNIVPLRQNYGYSMDWKQTAGLLEQLRKLPDSDFLPADPVADVFTKEEAGEIRLSWYYPPSADEANSIYGCITYLDGHVYFAFRKNKDDMPLQTWEIRNTEFIEYQKSFYDPTLPYDFHTYEAVTGTISVSHGYGSIELNTYEYMDYEIIEYTDDETPFGIRMRPKMLEEGSISVLYYPNDFTPDPDWTERSTGYSDNHPVTWYHTKQQQTMSSYPAKHYTGLPGDYVVLTEGLDAWTEEYFMDSSTIFTDMELAGDYLTQQEILDRIRPLLPDSQTDILYAEVNGERRVVGASFSNQTGIWSITTRAYGSKEPVLLMTMDVYGNIIDNFLKTQ